MNKIVAYILILIGIVLLVINLFSDFETLADANTKKMTSVIFSVCLILLGGIVFFVTKIKQKRSS